MAANDRQNILLLVRVVQDGDIPEIERILELGSYINADEGANINAKALYRNLLMLAIDALQEEAAIVLINKGINLNHRYWGIEGKQSARDLAAENGLQLVVQLIDSLLPVSQQLFYAVCDGALDRVKELVRHIDTDVNMKVNLYGEKTTGTVGYTLLLLAIRNGHEDVAVFLVEKGADITFKHQEWDRLKPESDPVLIKSFDARTLASENNMRTLEHLLNKKLDGELNLKHKAGQQETTPYTNHDRKENGTTTLNDNASVQSRPPRTLADVEVSTFPADPRSAPEKTVSNTQLKNNAWTTQKSHCCCVIL